MKKAFLLLCLSVTAVLAMAQNASLQIIHNSPTPTVDIWVNGQKFLDSLEFREATPFVNVPAGVDLEIGIAPSPSTDTSQILADYTVNLTEDEAYVAMATGIVGDTVTPFDVLIFDDARTRSNDPMNVDFFIYHGATDAPMIDAYARGVAQLADDISFGGSTDYIEVPAANYIVDITDPNDANTIIASYSAPLLTGRGAAAVVFASGFLSPPTMDDPAFGLFVALPNGTVIPLPQLSNTARLQVIHNSPSPTVDIWVNGAKLLDSFEYRTATPFIDVPAGTNLEIGVAPSPSADTSEIIATFDAILAPDAKYVAIATGIVGDMNTPFDLAIIADAQEETSQAGNTDFAIYHGSTDAPNVDVIARGVATLADSLGYGASTDYISVPSQDYTIDIAAATDPRVIVASYTAPLSALPDSALVVFASGFLAPDMGQPAFGLFAALPNGNIIALPAATAEAQLQIIHNSPSPTVDIWVNGSKILDSLEYRTATGFLDVPAGTNLEIGVAPSPSTDPTQIIATFDVILNPDEAYVAIATGIVGDQNTPFDLELIDNVRTRATNPDNVDFVIYHGSTDAPTVDIIARDVAKLGDDVSYRDVSPYLEVPAANYTIDITDPIRNELIVASFLAPLSTGRGAAAVVFASGFLSPPTMDDPGFGLFVALPNGTVIPLPQLENKARLQILHNSPSPVVDIWVNDQLFLDSFEYRTATPYIDIDAATIINIGIAPSPSDDTSDIIARFEPVLTPDETYLVIATGIVGDQNTPFTLKVIEGARETAEDPSNFSTAVYHGATDAPEIDALVRGVGPAASGLEYFENTAYGDIPVADYFIDITPAGDPATRLYSYEASLQGLEGQAGLIFASGFVADTSEDVSFGLFLLLPDGQVLALPEEGGVSTVTPAKLGLEMMPTLTSGEDVMITWPAAQSTDYAIYVVGSQGQLVYQADVEGFNASITKNIPVNNLTKGTYQVIISNGKNLETKSFVVQ